MTEYRIDKTGSNGALIIKDQWSFSKIIDKKIYGIIATNPVHAWIWKVLTPFNFLINIVVIAIGIALIVISNKDNKLSKTVSSKPKIITPKKAINIANQVLILIFSLKKKKAKIAPKGMNNWVAIAGEVSSPAKSSPKKLIEKYNTPLIKDNNDTGKILFFGIFRNGKRIINKRENLKKRTKKGGK